MLGFTAILNFDDSNEFYFIRGSCRGAWHIRHSGTLPGTCFCTKVGIDAPNLEAINTLSMRKVCKECLTLYTLQEMAV